MIDFNQDLGGLVYNGQRIASEQPSLAKIIRLHPSSPGFRHSLQEWQEAWNSTGKTVASLADFYQVLSQISVDRKSPNPKIAQEAEAERTRLISLITAEGYMTSTVLDNTADPTKVVITHNQFSKKASPYADGYHALDTAGQHLLGIPSSQQPQVESIGYFQALFDTLDSWDEISRKIALLEVSQLDLAKWSTTKDSYVSILFRTPLLGGHHLYLGWFPMEHASMSFGVKLR